MNKYNTNRLLIVYTANTAMKGKRGIIIFLKKKESVTKLKGPCYISLLLNFDNFREAISYEDIGMLKSKAKMNCCVLRNGQNRVSPYNTNNNVNQASDEKKKLITFTN